MRGLHAGADQPEAFVVVARGGAEGENTRQNAPIPPTIERRGDRGVEQCYDPDASRASIAAAALSWASE